MANEKIVNRENLKAFRQAYDTRLENGTLVPEKSQTAKNLLPVSSASGSTQTAPFINQGTATNNNDSQAVVDTGTLGQHLEKQGHTVVVNQQVVNGDFSNGSNGWAYDVNAISVSGSASPITITFLVDMSAMAVLQLYRQTQTITGHKYLIYLKVKPSRNCNIIARMASDFSINENCVADTWNNIFGIYTSSQTGNTETNVFSWDTNLVTGDTIQVANFFAVDLTQMFNGDIPQDLLDNPSNFYRYYNGSLDYNTGTLVNSNGRYLVNGGQNVWDEELESGYYSDTDGSKVSNAAWGRSKNYIKVIPNATYYLKQTNTEQVMYYFMYDINHNYISHGAVGPSGGTFTTASNCCYITICKYNWTTYNHDITISLYYAGEDYSQYVPYEQPKVYDTGDEVLRQAGSVKDYKEPNGTIHRRVGSVDLGSLEWNRTTSYANPFFYTSISNRKTGENNNLMSSLYSKFNSTFSSQFGDNAPNMSICFGADANSVQVFVRNDSYSDNTTFKTAMSGVYLFYELATPTTEQGTPFSENMDINDMGNMAWYSAYTDENTNTLVSVPQGCKIFYPAWYVGFIDSLGQRADIEWSADNVVSQSGLNTIDTKHDNLYAIMQENVGGTLRHQLAESASIDFDNTAWVDLGSLTFTRTEESGTYYFIVRLDNGALPTAGGKPSLCPIYKAGTDFASLTDKQYTFADASFSVSFSTLVIRYDAYTDATAFKNAMKGILFAYEKA